MAYQGFEVGKVYTLITDCPAWRACNVNPEGNAVWGDYSYIKDGMVVFKAGVKFKKLEDGFNGEIAFEMDDDKDYEMAFRYINQKQLNKIYKSFDLKTVN